MKLISLGVSVIATLILFYSSLSFAQAWVTVPSAVTAGEEVEIQGGGFAPNESVTINIIFPDNTLTTQNAIADGEGNLSIFVLTDLDGEYRFQAHPETDPEALTYEAIMMVSP